MTFSLRELLLLVACVAFGCFGWMWGHSYFNPSPSLMARCVLLALLTIPLVMVLALLILSRGKLSLSIIIGIAVNFALIVAKIGVFPYPIYYLPFIGLGSLPIAALTGSIGFALEQDRNPALKTIFLLVAILLAVAELAFLIRMR